MAGSTITRRFARRCASSSRRRTLRRHGAAHGERSGRIPCASLSSAAIYRVGTVPGISPRALLSGSSLRLCDRASYTALAIQDSPEHEGKAAATDAHAMRLGYLGRVPPVFLDDTHPVAAVIAARLADRTIHRASWAQIARSADTRGSVDTVRKQVRHWAGELEIALPTIPPGRPRAKDALAG